MITRVASSLILLCLTSCSLVPNSIRPEVQHMSHAMQHFGPDQTHYGVNTLELMAHWDIGKVAYFEVGEGIALDKRSGCERYQDSGYGEIIGPREQFIARVGLVIPLK